jgi:Nup133 N terminal like
MTGQLQVEYRGVVPVPPQLTHAASRVECMSLSGLLPEIHHAWLTVDNHLYLWDYSSEGGDVKEVITIEAPTQCCCLHY